MITCAKVLQLMVILCSLFSADSVECPPNEYYPGPDCSMEPYCSPRAQYSLVIQIREHDCICWCQPGTFRNLITKKCVFNCPKGSIGIE